MSTSDTNIDRIARAYGYLLSLLGLMACVLLFAMMMVIVADVVVRNIRIIPGLYALSWANEVTEYALYLITLLIIPWLLRQGQHIRVDIVLVILPRRLGWYIEWFCDLIAFVCCLTIAFYGWKAAALSKAKGLLAIKTMVLPEWWLIAPIQVCFVLLAIEMVFRMARLYSGERQARPDRGTLG